MSNTHLYKNLDYIKKRIFNKSEFIFYENFNGESIISMCCYDIKLKSKISKEYLMSLSFLENPEIEEPIINILISDFISKHIDDFIKRENRERNLNELV